MQILTLGGTVGLLLLGSQLVGVGGVGVAVVCVNMGLQRGAERLAPFEEGAVGVGQLGVFRKGGIL